MPCLYGDGEGALKTTLFKKLLVIFSSLAGTEEKQVYHKREYSQHPQVRLISKVN